MAVPARPSRSGRLWSLQRTSAVLLLVGAGTHFAIQHFTPAALSTAVTVAARFSRPGWQLFYLILLAVALFHGVNGVTGILRDHLHASRSAGLCAAVLWGLAAIFLATGATNIFSAGNSLPALKAWYAAHGLPDGHSAGSPPSPVDAGDFAFGSDEMRELHLLAVYLTRHTHRTEPNPDPLADIFTAADPRDAVAGGASFDAWARARLTDPPVPGDRSRVFPTTRDFALWALHVRRADALRRSEEPDLRAAAQGVLARTADLPPYVPVPAQEDEP